MNSQQPFLEVGKTYIEIDFDGLPSGSLFRYDGIVNNRHVFQCLEFDCEDVTKEFPISPQIAGYEGISYDPKSLEDWFYKQQVQ